MAQFEIGDVVQLNSGGSLMTVREILEPRHPATCGDIGCQWHRDDGELQSSIFPVEILKLAAADKQNWETYYYDTSVPGSRQSMEEMLKDSPKRWILIPKEPCLAPRS